MMEFVKGLWLFFKDLIKIGGPVIVILFTLAIFAGAIRWSNKTKDNLITIGKSPVLLVLWLAITIFLIIMVYKYVTPLF